MDIFKQRYPDLAFLLSFFNEKGALLPEDPKPLVAWLKQQCLEELEVIYIIGLTGYPLPPSLQQWLKGKKERALIFVENDLAAFASFSQDALISHPQVHLHYAEDDPSEALAQKFPISNPAIFAHKEFNSSLLKRRSIAYSALYSDVLYSHKIVDNVVANFRSLSAAFSPKGSFKNTPAIICGAGPSLEKDLPLLPLARERCLIFAGGTAITSLTQAGVHPHIAMALDPNEEEFDRLRQSHFFEGAFLFGSRLQRHVFATLNGPLGYMQTDTGGLIEPWLESHLGLSGEPIGPDLGDEAFSVTTLAVSLAFALCCNPIIFSGVDLAFSGGQRYPKGIDADPDREERVLSTDIYGRVVETKIRWEMESGCIADFAKKHPERRFFNASRGGIGFAGIENIALSELIETLPQKDLDGLVHTWIENNPLSIEKGKLDGVLKELVLSLQTCASLTENILFELGKGKKTGKITLFEMDFTEELAYQLLLHGIDQALGHILHRYHPYLDPEEGALERKKAKYIEILRQIREFQKLPSLQI